ncbi:hypothetical protein SAMN04489740_0833 [Arthrobacter alpinus]|uniref:Uncharacterized protein n=1 Tax=Arthrobacter alpinus TaxID=656366 RepID=A0A1H5GRY5_9MICC|nr:hypothetical protein [Arthrobacter alpinus]SEE18410.1 hypothetical protein SAMN04489740_0833 [Arthrobacter alpinus]
MAMAPIAEGERWAYRRASRPFEEVSVLKVVSQSGNRKVRVQFEDGPNAGEIQWVNRQQLKVLWAQRREFLDREQRFAEAKSRVAEAQDSHLLAAGLIISESIDVTIASDHNHGILRVGDAVILADHVQISVTDLTGDACFEDGGYLYLPWPAMRTVAIAKAKIDPGIVLDMVDRDAKEWNSVAQQTTYYAAVRPMAHQTIDHPWPEYETQKLAWNVIRGWCGEVALDRWSELDRVRQDNIRLANLLERALKQLERAGGTYHAARLRGEAGRAFETNSKRTTKL